jgi:alkanesulfonate monooxygenase SsuD/methylene tetrahydromethanopterin reductase-like flavin-dependent oxidoreductase (luciferase family)
MSGGRVIAGMVPGYLAGEFSALGVALADRGPLLDEALAAMKAAWTGEPVFMTSSRWKANGNVMLPRPCRQPHPPIWIGGNSLGAIRRAARFGQGWMPFPAQPGSESSAVRTAAITSLADLRERIGVLRAETKAAGRTDTIDVSMTPFTHQHHPRGRENYDPPALLDEAQQLSEIGVTWLSLKARSPSRKELLKNIERFAKDVIRR